MAVIFQASTIKIINDNMHNGSTLIQVFLVRIILKYFILVITKGKLLKLAFKVNE